MPEYLVVCRTQAGVRFGKGDPLLLRGFPSEYGPVDVLFQTRLAPNSGFSKPVPMGLMAEIRGPAPTLDEALQHFSQTAQSICTLLALLGNTSLEDLVPELGYEITPGVTERDFFQQFLPEERLLLIQRRRLPAELVTRILHKLYHHPEAARLQRAIGQYYQAMQNWEPGREVLALAHLWMGTEALTPVTLRRILNENQSDRTALAESWNAEVRSLEAEVRRRIIMRGDEESYSRARRASDGFEHGFLAFAEVHSASERVRARVADHLRTAILTELSLSAEDLSELVSLGYEKPGHLRVVKYVRGKLMGPEGDLAAPDQAYPILAWRTKYKEVPNPTDELTITLEENFTGRFAEGVSFRLVGIEAWSGQAEGLRVADPSETERAGS